MRRLEKILLIRFSSMGDILLASPLIRVLRLAHPTAQIDFMVKREYADLLKHNPHLSSVIELRSDGREELKELRSAVGRERYDAILDIHNSLRSRYVRTFNRARHVKVVRKRLIARFALVRFKRNFYGGAVPVAERYLETARRFGVRDDGGGLEVFFPEDTRRSVAALLARYRLERHGTVLGMAPMAKHATKRWLPERFVEFGVRFVKESGAKILVFGSKGESDLCGDIAHMINGGAGASAAESLAGKITILETAAILDHCSLVLSNDTGIMHLAAARQRKVLALFGSTVREFGFFPYRTGNIVLENAGLPCRPCSHIGLPRCPEGHFRCMKEINVDRALAAARTLLAGDPQSQPAG